ncbi:chlorohydrolase [Streptococcus pneumoniae]|uniref:hypothetical protein n=1 Tax=Streptococcus pneumoniae TaxID=1313 RepID=UPI0005E5BEB0|nr:hypothetical protein [Streptococcus pneumoniae]CKH94798.1 chlorohydrolase [Streptococcus pneumoniae]
MKIKEQTRKLAAGCSKHCFEVADKTDEVTLSGCSKHCFEVVDDTVEVVRIRLTKSVTYIYGKVKLTWFEEIFEEYKQKGRARVLI